MEQNENKYDLSSELSDDETPEVEEKPVWEKKKTDSAMREDEEIDENEPLIVVRPSWWNYFWHLVLFFLIVPLIIAFWLRASAKLSVYRDRVVVERGLLSKDYKEVFCADIRTIDVKQTFFQRFLGIGYIAVATAGDNYEFELNGIPNPLKLKDLIHERKRANLNRKK